MSFLPVSYTHLPFFISFKMDIPDKRSVEHQQEHTKHSSCEKPCSAPTPCDKKRHAEAFH